MKIPQTVAEALTDHVTLSLNPSIGCISEHLPAAAAERGWGGGLAAHAQTAALRFGDVYLRQRSEMRQIALSGV